MSIEMIDVLTEQGGETGLRLPREDVHRQGLWHATMACWVVLVGPEGPRVVVSRRSPRKTNYPGCFDATASGHLAAGEVPADGVREIREEIGLDVTFDDLIPVGVLPVVSDCPGSDGSVTAYREYTHTFVLEMDESAEIVPDPDEIDGFVLVPVHAFVTMAAQGTAAVGWSMGTADPSEQVCIDRAAFVPADVAFWGPLADALTRRYL